MRALRNNIAQKPTKIKQKKLVYSCIDNMEVLGKLS